MDKEVPRGYEDIHGDSIPEHYYQEQYHRATDELAEKIKKSGIDLEGLCGTGDPKLAILSTAKSRGVSLVVLGVRSFRHPGRFRGEGDVAREVMESSSVPVVAVP
ncbi:MAG TPA: universal stress protein [Nitrososphaerales archaeon]|nr:universal stress protein [Nitrososphaerales archaeon]